MIQYFESEGSILDSLNSNYTAQNFLVSSGYVSMITIGGRPILPPVVSDCLAQIYAYLGSYRKLWQYRHVVLYLTH